MWVQAQDNAVSPYLRLLPMLLGIGSPGTLAKVRCVCARARACLRVRVRVRVRVHTYIHTYMYVCMHV
jgi:hypothetical protein